MDARQIAGLRGLPVEIYLKIIEYVFVARDIAALSAACSRFNLLNNQSGWRVFVQTRFPSLAPSLTAGASSTHGYWHTLARCLTEQSASWDRRAIKATLVSVDGPVVAPHDALLRWDGPSKTSGLFRLGEHDSDVATQRNSVHQSTAVMPVLSSMMQEDHNPSSDSIMVCGAGPDIYLQVSGNRNAGHQGSRAKLVIRHDGFHPGRNDITSITMIKSRGGLGEDSRPGVVDVIAGRSSGHLHLFAISHDQPSRVINTFHALNAEGVVSQRSVRATDVNRSSASLLAACSDKVLSLYNLSAVNRHDVWPDVELELEPDQPYTRAWTTKFISSDKVAVGFGSSSYPLALYHATATGLTRQYKIEAPNTNSTHSRLEVRKMRAVYAIEPIAPLSNAGGSLNGTTFLSGWYDGACRLYDVRASEAPVTTYYDPVDVSSAVYSLATFGQERFLVGSAGSILKVFDFRLGAKAYFYTDALPCSSRRPFPMPDVRTDYIREGIPKKFCLSCHVDRFTGKAHSCTFHIASRADFYRPNANIYLKPLGLRISSRRARTDEEPIYSISRPGAACPIVYASTKGTVYELTVQPDQTLHSCIPLKMYETDDGIHSYGEPTDFIPRLRSQRSKQHLQPNMYNSFAAAYRLETSWLDGLDNQSQEYAD